MKKKPTVYGAFAVIFALAFTACAATPAPAPEPSPMEELSRAIRDVSNHLNGNVPSGRMIAFVNVQSGSAELSNFIIDDLIANAVTDRIFTVVDRQRLDYIRAEQNIQLSGEVDDETARSIGSFLGAHTIVSGRVSSFGGHFRLTIRALDVETAEVQGQYNRIIGTERAMATLMGAGGGQVAQAPVVQVARAPVARSLATQVVQVPAGQVTPAAPTVTAIEVTARSAGTLFFQDREVATLWDNETYTIAIDGPGTFALRLAMADRAETRSVVINVRGITRVNLGGTFAVGDVGPAGGIIFYDRGRHIDGWRWLEAAPRDLVPSEWGAYGQNVIGTSTGLGTGRQNTQIIVDNLRQRNEVGRAADTAQNFAHNGFTDWFLPSREELNLMFINLRQKGLGNFTNNWYWSSSQANANEAWYQSFFSNRTAGRQEHRTAAGIGLHPHGKHQVFHVRPIQAF